MAFIPPLPLLHHRPKTIITPRHPPRIPPTATHTPPLQNAIEPSAPPPASNPSPSPPDIHTESLILLEWPAISAQVVRHASTTAGRNALLPTPVGLPIPATREESEHLLSETRAAIHLERTLQKKVSFTGVHDLIEVATLAEKGRILTGKELIMVAETLGSARQIRRTIDSGENVDVLKEMVRDMRTWPEVERKIRDVIDDFGVVMETDVELRAIRREMRETMGEIRKKLNEIMMRNAEGVQERLIVQRLERFVIPVKAGFKARFGGVVHDASSSGQTLYVEPGGVKRLNDRMRELGGRERTRVKVVLKALSEVVKGVAGDLRRVCGVLGRVDAAVARGRYAGEIGGVDVEFGDVGVAMVDVRHPLLGGEVVPIRFEVGGGVRCVCVTGPNTGGKTVALKTLGVVVLMAKAGLFVPGGGGKCCVRFFEGVLADIGDDQSLVQSLSTFSGHVRRICRILEGGSGGCLVLLDEVGAGTDPGEGAALGVAILKWLVERVALVFATTHHGELKRLKYEDGRFENASVEFDDVLMKPTFRLVWGVSGRSNALAIAERLGLERGVVDMAREVRGGEVLRMEGEMKEVERMKREVEVGLEEVERMRVEVGERLDRLREREEGLRREQKEALESEVREARKLIAKVVRDVQKGGGGNKAVEKLERIVGKTEGGVVDGGEIQVGDWVHVPRLGGEVQVVDVVAGKEFVVAMGGMKAKVKVREISAVRKGGMVKEVVDKDQRGDEFGVMGEKRVAVRTAANTIDIRGERVEGAQAKVDSAIDRALAMGSVWIIHGHGTGRLRNGIRQFLNEHQLVERIEDAQQEEGGRGVTVAYLT